MVKCCSQRSLRLRRIATKKATAAANKAVKAGGHVKPKKAKKKTAPKKKATAKKATPCRACGHGRR